MKKALKYVLRILWVLLLVEVGAWAVLSAQLREPVTWGGLKERQVQVALLEVQGQPGAGPAPASNEAEAAARRRAFVLERDHVHPYLGFTGRYHEGRSGKGFAWIMGPELADPESPLFDPSEETLVVGLSGGSVAAAICSAAWTDLRDGLLSIPALAGKDVFFLWLASPGHKQPQQHLALEYALDLGVKFDLVINFDGFNDVALHPIGNGPNHVFMPFPRDWAVRTNTDESYVVHVGAQKLIEKQRVIAARDAITSPLRFSMVRQLWWAYRERDLRRQSAAITAEMREAVNQLGEHDIGRLGPPREYGSFEELAEDMVALWARCSLNMSDSCAAVGARYYHLLQPNQYVPGSKPLTPEELENAYKEDSPYRATVERCYPLLSAAGEELRARGVNFTDLTYLFRDDDVTYYEDFCCHFNRQGSQRLAAAIVAAVRADLE